MINVAIIEDVEAILNSITRFLNAQEGFTSSSVQYLTKQGREELLTAAVERGPNQIIQ